MLPKVTIYTDRFLPDWVGARAIGPFVLIRPKYKDDKGIHAHEYTHVKQWFRWTALWAILVTLALLVLPEAAHIIVPFYGLSVGIFHLMYALVKSFRLESEVEAYAAQVNAGADLDKMAAALANPNYKFNIGFEEAKNLLRD
jgi:uncharacterized membrane protein